MKSLLESVTKYFSSELVESCKRINKFLLIYTVLFIIIAMGLKYAIPFVIALVIAMSLRPIKNRILNINKRFKKFKISEGFVSMLLTVTIVAAMGFLIFIIAAKIGRQLTNFYTYITDKDTLNTIMNTTLIEINQLLNNVSDLDPFILEKINELVPKLISLGTSFAAIFVKNLLDIVVSIPAAFIMVLITIIATFFFTKDIDVIQVKLKKAFSDKGLELIRRARKKTNEIFGGYVKAFLIIMVVVIIYTAVIYKFVGIKYAIVVAIITGVLDALPIFGAGLVYGIIGISAFLGGNYKGVLVIVLGYVGCVVLRQFLQQQLMSTFLGLNPLVVIIGIFLIVTPLGFVGMFYFLGAFIIYDIITPPKNIQTIDEVEKVD